MASGDPGDKGEPTSIESIAAQSIFFPEQLGTPPERVHDDVIALGGDVKRPPEVHFLLPQPLHPGTEGNSSSRAFRHRNKEDSTCPELLVLQLLLGWETVWPLN